MDDSDARASLVDQRDLNLALHGIYGLYAASFFVGFTSIVAVIIAYLKRRDAAGTIYESHMIWAIRTFWILIIVGAIGFVLSWVLIGIPILILLGIWLLYRIIKGWVRLLERQPVENPAGFF